MVILVLFFLYLHNDISWSERLCRRFSLAKCIPNICAFFLRRLLWFTWLRSMYANHNFFVVINRVSSFSIQSFQLCECIYVLFYIAAKWVRLINCKMTYKNMITFQRPCTWATLSCTRNSNSTKLFSFDLCILFRNTFSPHFVYRLCGFVPVNIEMYSLTFSKLKERLFRWKFNWPEVLCVDEVFSSGFLELNL